MPKVSSSRPLKSNTLIPPTPYDIYAFEKVGHLKSHGSASNTDLIRRMWSAEPEDVKAFYARRAFVAREGMIQSKWKRENKSKKGRITGPTRSQEPMAKTTPLIQPPPSIVLRHPELPISAVKTADVLADISPGDMKIFQDIFFKNDQKIFDEYTTMVEEGDSEMSTPDLDTSRTECSTVGPATPADWDLPVIPQSWLAASGVSLESERANLLRTDNGELPAPPSQPALPPPPDLDIMQFVVENPYNEDFEAMLRDVENSNGQNSIDSLLRGIDRLAQLGGAWGDYFTDFNSTYTRSL